MGLLVWVSLLGLHNRLCVLRGSFKMIIKLSNWKYFKSTWWFCLCFPPSSFSCFWTVLHWQPRGAMFSLISGDVQCGGVRRPTSSWKDSKTRSLCCISCVPSYNPSRGKKYILAGMSILSHIFPLHFSLMVTPDWIIRSVSYKREGKLRQGFQSSFCWQLFKWSFLGSSVSNTVILSELVTMNYDNLSWYARL